MRYATDDRVTWVYTDSSQWVVKCQLGKRNWVRIEYVRYEFAIGATCSCDAVCYDSRGGVGMVEIEFDTTMSKSRLCALFCMWLDWWSICLDEVLGRKRCRIVSCEVPLLRSVYVRNTK